MDPGIAIALVLILLFGFGSGPAEFIVPASESDVNLLARIIDVEAGGETRRGKVAVGAVVVNRVKDPRFPSTIRGVIYEPNQFATGALNRFPRPTDASIEAAIAALRGEDPTRGALFFYNPDLARTTQWWANRPNRVRIGNHVFSQ